MKNEKKPEYNKDISNESAKTVESPAYKAEATDAAHVLQAKEEIANRTSMHVQEVIGNSSVGIDEKEELLEGSAEVMGQIAGEVSTKLSKVASEHTKVAVGEVAKELKFKQEILKKVAQQVKEVSTDAAVASKAKQEILKKAAYDISTASSDIATSMAKMADVAAGNFSIHR